MRPFDYLELPWADQAPALRNWLSGLSRQQIDALEENSDALSEALTPFIPDAPQLAELVALPLFPRRQLIVDQRSDFRVPGRKWEQILAFAESLPYAGGPLLEWCAGKGHLGRVLAQGHGAAVESIERESNLCRTGAELAARSGTPLQFHNLDVLSGEVEEVLKPEHHAVALHACGDLHRRLIELAPRRHSRALSISPCCYHLTVDEIYRPYAAPAKASKLALTRFDLQLSQQETVTGGQRIRRMREQEMIWRLGFDLLQRELRGRDAYLTIPSMSKSLLQNGFPDFCRWAAQQQGLPLPENIDFQFYESRGAKRRLEVARIEIVRHLFRRPLELWLVLDRALGLEEAGYRVTLGAFCKKPLTPRNILIHAELRKSN